MRPTARFVLANRTIIGAYAARRLVLGTPDPRPHRPQRLPKHVRYRCATPRRGFVLTDPIWPVCTASDRLSLHRSKAASAPSAPTARARHRCATARSDFRAREAHVLPGAGRPVEPTPLGSCFAGRTRRGIGRRSSGCFHGPDVPQPCRGRTVDRDKTTGGVDTRSPNPVAWTVPSHWRDRPADGGTGNALEAKPAFMVAAAILSLAALAPSDVGIVSAQRGMPATKECSGFTGSAGSYCTITSSNLRAIPVDSMTILYLPARQHCSLRGRQ